MAKAGERPRGAPCLLASSILVSCAVWASGIRFDCPEADQGDFPAPPTKIAELGPAHVSIVAAMGDSITAAFAARATLYEDRDLSWSIGTGGDNNLTLPYLLRRYSSGTAPSSPPRHPLYGFSTTKRLPADATHLPKGDYHPLTDHLNVAESEGSVERGSMDEQWRYFHSAMRKEPDVQTRWKVLTIWMTANDVCGACDGPKDLTQWTNSFEQVLTNVTSNYRNIYINLMSTLELSDVARLQRSVVFCSVEHRLLLKECGCIDRGNSTQLKMLDDNVHAMNARLESVAKNWTIRLSNAGRDDVAVVYQPFLEGIGPTLDISFLNTLDCFHPAAKAHEQLAMGLWASMLCKDRGTACGHKFPEDTAYCVPRNATFYVPSEKSQ